MVVSTFFLLLIICYLVFHSFPPTLDESSLRFFQFLQIFLKISFWLLYYFLFHWYVFFQYWGPNPEHITTELRFSILFSFDFCDNASLIVWVGPELVILLPQPSSVMRLHIDTVVLGDSWSHFYHPLLLPSSQSVSGCSQSCAHHLTGSACQRCLRALHSGYATLVCGLILSSQNVPSQT